MRKIVTLLILIVLIFVLVSRNSLEAFMLCEGKKTETVGFSIESLVPGPTIYIVAGIHGNEKAGSVAALALNDLKLKRGKLIVLPEANKMACENETRTIPSLGDLNRAFPGKVKGMQVEMLASEITGHIVENKPDYILDLHESRNYRVNQTYAIGRSIIFSDFEVSNLVLDMIDELNIDTEDNYVYFTEAKIGTINKELTELGYPVITFEGDVLLDFDERVDEQKKFIYLILEEMDML